jgi:hypothetical protein
MDNGGPAASAKRRWLVTAAALVFGWAIASSKAPAGGLHTSQVFSGSSPCGASIQQLLKIPSGVACDLIQWNVTLQRDARTQAPSYYEIRGRYGRLVEGTVTLDDEARPIERFGRWTVGTGTGSDRDATVYDLDDAISLLPVGPNVLHLLDGERRLLVGTSGWSYTLNRDDTGEGRVSRLLALFQPDLTYPISPKADGSDAFGVFAGRSPCQGIAEELDIPVSVACVRAKWRVTLYQDPRAGTPTTYKVEGSLFKQGPRQGTWTLTRGTPQDPEAVVYRLAPSETQRELLLLKGDDGVLFFLDRERRPMVGHADFSYTLNSES